MTAPFELIVTQWLPQSGMDHHLWQWVKEECEEEVSVAVSQYVGDDPLEDPLRVRVVFLQFRDGKREEYGPPKLVLWSGGRFLNW